MSGGQGHLFVSANTAAAGGLTNTYVLNNIFSDGVYVTGSQAWLSTSLIGAWDYNLSSPTGIANPAFFGPHNIKSATNQWANVSGMSFALPPGSQAIGAALDTSSTFVLNGKTFPALPGAPSVDMGAVDYRRRIDPPQNLHVVQN